MPRDPKNSSVTTYGWPTTPGGYGYVHLFKWGINYKWYALIANAETEALANRVINLEDGGADPNGVWLYNYDMEDPSTYNSVELLSPRLCTKMVKSTQRYNGWTGYCTYVLPEELQYVLISP
jgi:hypothetical protein